MKIKDIFFRKSNALLTKQEIDKIFRKIIVISSFIFVYILISIICVVLNYTASKYSYSDENYDYYTINVAQVNVAFAISVINELFIVSLSILLFIIYLKYCKGINKVMKEYKIYTEFRNTLSLIVPIFILGISCPLISIMINALYLYGPIFNRTTFILLSVLVGLAEIALFVIFIVLFAKSINRRRDLEKDLNEK